MRSVYKATMEMIDVARPQKPVGIPMVGDGKRIEYEKWFNSCDLCIHIDRKYGCVRLGVVTYSNGVSRGFPLVPGGCKSWTSKTK